MNCGLLPNSRRHIADACGLQLVDSLFCFFLQAHCDLVFAPTLDDAFAHFGQRALT